MIPNCPKLKGMKTIYELSRLLKSHLSQPQFRRAPEEFITRGDGVQAE